MKLSGPAALAATLCLCSGALAQYVVSPSASASVAGQTGLNTLLRDEGDPRTYQVRLLAADLGLDAGARVEAIGLRLSTLANLTEAWPPTGGATWSDYEITLSQDANPAIPLSTTFSQNQLNPVLVRSGSMTIPAGSFTVGAVPYGVTPNQWGYEIILDEAYEYAGGNVIVTVRHTGSNLWQEAPFVDAVEIPGRAVWNQSFTDPTGNESDTVTILRLRTADEGTFVAPNRLTHEGGAQLANTLLSPSGRTVQFQYAAAELGGLQVGEIITGIAIRAADGMPGSSWPSVGGATFDAYEITLSQAANPHAAMSGTFGSNQASARLVRSGPMTIPEGAFVEVGGGTPTDFHEIPITPYQYMGGDLVVSIAHTGHDLASSVNLEGIAGLSSTTNYVWGNTYQAASGTVSVGTVTPALRFSRRASFGLNVLWDNGGIVNRPGEGFGGANLSQVIRPHSGVGMNASAASGMRVADEVHVEDPAGWTLDRIVVRAFTTGDTTGNPSLITGGTVRVWDGIPEAFGSAIVAQSSVVDQHAWTGAYRTVFASPLSASRPVREIGFDFPTNPILPRGTYYIDQSFEAPVTGAFVVPVQHFGGHKTGDGLRRTGAGAWGPSLDVASQRQVEFPFVMLGSVRQCRADMSTTAVPGTAGYGVPNGVLNNDDFFYYLTQFASGNAAVADMTNTAIPGAQGYGVPNGVVNNDDFFFYLSLFATGC